MKKYLIYAIISAFISVTGLTAMLIFLDPLTTLIAWAYGSITTTCCFACFTLYYYYKNPPKTKKKLTDEVVTKNAITDEEYVKILAHCTGLQACHNCEYNDGCPIDNETTVAVIHRLQSKVAELREVNAGLALANLCDLPPNEDCLTDNEFEVARKTIAEQKAEIKRLTNVYNHNIDHFVKENAELQEQVNELKVYLASEKVCSKQAVKDTAEKFAEMAKERKIEMGTDGHSYCMVFVDDIDEICKKITEEN